MDREFSVENLQSDASLDLRNIGDAAWKAILANCRATAVHFYNLKITSLAGIENLRSVHNLRIVWAAKLENLKPAFQMGSLERLLISDLKLLREIEGIEKLANLRELHLSGNLGSLDPPMRLTSLVPIAQLEKLEKLELRNIRLEDDDISFVGYCFPNLRELKLSSRFERRQFAYIARKLNAQLTEPIAASFQTNIECDECGELQYIFVGRRMPILCPACDGLRFQKLTDEFEKMMQEN